MAKRIPVAARSAADTVHSKRKYRLIPPWPPHFVSQHYLMLFFDITPFYGGSGNVNQIYSLFIQALKFYQRDSFLHHCPADSCHPLLTFKLNDTGDLRVIAQISTYGKTNVYQLFIFCENFI